MPSTTDEMRKTYERLQATKDGELIRLISLPPRKTDDHFVSPPTLPPVSLALFQQSRQDTETRDTLSRDLVEQRSHPPASPQRKQGMDAPNSQALAGAGGGRGAGGPSTANAGGGGSSGGSSGSGPGVTNANQFDYLHMLGSALTPAATPATALTPAPTPPPPGNTTPMPHPFDEPMGYKMTPPLLATASSLMTIMPSNGTMSANAPPVLDMNTGETLPTKDSNNGSPFSLTVPLDTFATWSENLLAQSTGTVMNYTWDVSQAPDLTGVHTGGTLGGSLQGTWASFTGAPRTDKIIVTEHLQNGQTPATTLTYLVAGTDSPAYSASRPTSSATWPTVLTPDMMSSGQATVDAGPNASAGLADGSAQTSFSMPSYSPNAAPVALDYNSTTANPKPIFLVRYQFATTPQPGNNIALQLTLNNGTPGPIVTYPTFGYQAGDWAQFALQGDATGLSTGRYPWTIGLALNYTPPNPPVPLPVAYSGNVGIVNQASSPYGAGWAVDNVEQLIPVSGGVMIVNPDGTSLFFAGSGGSFTSPAGDFSTLTQSGGNYVRTMPDGTQINFNSGGQQTSVVDTDGNITGYSYTAGLLTGITDMDGQITTLTYSGGKLASILDPAGRSATLAYTGSQLTSITDPGGNLWKYGYDSSNDLIALTDANNHATTFGYSSSGRVNSVLRADGTSVTLTPEQTAQGQLAAADQALYTDANNKTSNIGLDWLGFGLDVQDMDPLGDTSLTYLDANGLPWLTSDMLGERERAFYDSKGNVTKDVAPDDSFWQYSYNNFSEVTQATDPTGDTTTYAYNAKGDLTGITDALGNLTTLTYNPQGFVTSITDPLLHATTFGYNTLNLLTTITNALNQSTTLAYDSAGDLTSSTDARGFASTFGYNTLGWMTSETLPISGSLNAVYTYSYDKVGNATGETTPAGDVLSYGYNAVNRLTSLNDPATGLTTYGYDPNGNLTGETNPLNQSMGYGYDAAGRQTSVTDALGHALSYTYNVVGEVTSVADPLNHVTSYSYTKLGQLASVTDPRGGVTSYKYNLAGDLTSLTDPDNNATTYAYNVLHQLTMTTDPLGHPTTYAYNAGGLLTATTDRNGRVIDYGYDVLNRLSSETWVGGNYQATYGYDAVGNLTLASDPFSSYSYAYNKANQLTSVDNAGTPGVPHVLLTYGYDTSGNRTSLTDSLGGNITYGFDNANRLTSLALSLSGSLAAQVTLGYNAANELTGLTRTSPGGDTISSSLTYDSAGRLTNILHKDATKSLTLANYTYGYDTANELTSYQDANSLLSYSYDANGELTGASGMLNGSMYNVGYGYDANGNRNMAGYSTGTGNRLTSDGVYNYTYDNEGNTLTQTNISTGSVTYYTWDFRNRLTEVQVKDSHGNLLNDEKFTYDVNNNRIGVSLNGVQQLYTVYDGMNPYMDFNGSGTLTQRYLTNPNALNEFYGQVSASGTPQWFLTDNINSIRQVVSTSGTSLDAITYDPYGQIVNQTNAANAPRFLYAGGAYDTVIDNYQFGIRFERPIDGGFTSPDPLGLSTGPNLYEYTRNSPLNTVDPTGLDAEPAPPKETEYMKNVTVIAISGVCNNDFAGENGKGVRTMTMFKDKKGNEFWVDCHGSRSPGFGIPTETGRIIPKDPKRPEKEIGKCDYNNGTNIFIFYTDKQGAFTKVRWYNIAATGGGGKLGNMNAAKMQIALNKILYDNRNDPAAAEKNILAFINKSALVDKKDRKPIYNIKKWDAP